MTNFGWSYPPGAANDPSAPYNQPEEPVETCDTCERDYAVSELDEGELRGTRSEGLTVPYHCPECGDELLERLVNEPEYAEEV